MLLNTTTTQGELIHAVLATQKRSQPFKAEQNFSFFPWSVEEWNKLDLKN